MEQIDPLISCKSCGCTRFESQFTITKTIGAKVYRRRECPRCLLLKKDDRRKALREWADGLKKTGTCSRCGFADWRALEYHHRDAAEKSFNIGDAIRVGLGRETIEEEIAKCTLLCANCHRITHHEDGTRTR